MLLQILNHEGIKISLDAAAACLFVDEWKHDFVFVVVVDDST